MRVLVYEHLTACGDAALPASLRREGTAMFDALRSDFASCPGIEVVTDFGERFDAALIIAPETDGVLTSLARRVERLGSRLLSPSAEFCVWASDKSRVAMTMRSAGVPMPRGILLQPGDTIPNDFPHPAVLKPNDGCGSLGIALLPLGEGGRRPDEGTSCDDGVCGVSADGIESRLTRSTLPSPDRCRDRPLPEGEVECFRLEQFVPGLAASVALLRGPAGVFPLPTCEQRLCDDGTFAYLGGKYPLEPTLAVRAERLALRAIAAMPEWYGYIGLDLVLGPAEDGSQDYLIEVNPRLTTSYVGLRAGCKTNLAEAMLDVVAGRAPRLSFRDRGVVFDADGTVRYA